MVGPSDESVELTGTTDNADYEEFLDNYSHPFAVQEGEVLQGRVLSVSETEVIVDIGRKSEGLVPASQFPQLDGRPAVKSGDVIEVMLDRSGQPVEGYNQHTHKRAHRLQVWDQ